MLEPCLSHRSWNRRRSLLGTLLILAMFAQPATAAAPLQLTDQAGRTFTLDSPARQVALVSINQEETLLALQAWNYVVSVPATSYNNPLLKYLNFPILPSTAFTESAGVSLEGLAGLHPDLIITWMGNRQIIQRLEEIGWPTLSVHPKTFSDLRTMVELVGNAVGKQERAAVLNRSFTEIETRLATELRTQVAPRQRVLWLGGKPGLVYGRKWIFHDIIRIAQAEDVAGELDFVPYVAEVSPEQILAWKPDVIAIIGEAPYGPEYFYRDTRLATVPAIRDHRIYRAPPGRKSQSPTAALLAILTAHWCYPDRLDANVTLSLLDQYHEFYYGLPFTTVHPEYPSQMIY